MALQFDPRTGQIVDERCADEKILHGEICLRYTLTEDDITRGEKPDYTPYADREGLFSYRDGVLLHEETGSILRVERQGEGLILTLSSLATDLSEFGLSLPFNFMGKREGGSTDAQFLFNSSYESEDGRIVYTYLLKPNGHHLGIAMLSEGDGWKMDYANDAYAHFFHRLNFYSNFDRAYKTERRPHLLRLYLFPVDGFASLLAEVAKAYALPVLTYGKSGGRIGESIPLTVYGEVDDLLVKTPSGERVIPYTDSFLLEEEGVTSITPRRGGLLGAGITVFGYADMVDLYHLAMSRLTSERMGYRNLCEWQCWIPALLRFLLHYRDRLTAAEIAALEGEVKKTLGVIMATEEEKAVPHLTVLAQPHDTFPAFHVYQSDRIQEQAFGVTIFLDAYRYFGEDIYLRYARETLNTLLDHHQDGEGAIRRKSGHDFSTVCAPMIPLVDMALFFRGRDEALADKYSAAARRLARHLFARGFDFPTETSSSKQFGTEIEEGSISCTALSLLYYCKNIERVEEYVGLSRRILDYHENWIIQTPRCYTYRSTLRWWETLWEGDATGPSICAGHAWTLWRAEADYLYYVLTGEREYREKSLASFMTNLSRVEADGRMTAVYTPDRIAGGGFAKKAEEVRFRIEPRTPDKEGGGLVHYLWVRLCDTFLQGENG